STMPSSSWCARSGPSASITAFSDSIHSRASAGSGSLCSTSFSQFIVSSATAHRPCWFVGRESPILPARPRAEVCQPDRHPAESADMPVSLPQREHARWRLPLLALVVLLIVLVPFLLQRVADRRVAEAADLVVHTLEVENM